MFPTDCDPVSDHSGIVQPSQPCLPAGLVSSAASDPTDGPSNAGHLCDEPRHGLGGKPGFSGVGKNGSLPSSPPPPTTTTKDVAHPGTRPSTLHLPIHHATVDQLAFPALRSLPVPVLVLNSLKTVVFANEAMGILLGLLPGSDHEQHAELSSLDGLLGQSLTQVGIDMAQEGQPVWLNWERFLDSLARQVNSGKLAAPDPTDASPEPLSSTAAAGATSHSAAVRRDRRPLQDAVMEVIISKKGLSKTVFGCGVHSQATSTCQVLANMVVTVWEVEEGQTYFTLTFTATTSSDVPRGILGVTGDTIIDSTRQTPLPVVTPLSAGSSQYSSSPSLRLGLNTASLASSPSIPLPTPSRTSISSTPSLLQKITVIKDALLDTTQTPVFAMWKDGSVAFPNRAAQKLFKKDADIDKCLDGFDILSAWELWDEEFTRQLSTDEFPISQLIRTEEPFSGRRVGMYDPEGKRLVFEVSGEVIRDDVTGDVLVGVVTAQDVTDVANMITQIKRQDDERFRLICDTMPQLVWTATPDGMHDFYNTRWYKYTGLTEAETLGVGWKSAFHPDDLVESDKLWEHSLRTGEPYVVEYRCRSKEGQWKWFIGRALPLRNKQTGQIEKWFGTCTDANESIETRLIAKQTQQQLLSVIAHSHVTIFTVDLDRKITMLEGALIWDTLGEDADHTSGVDSPWYIGKNVYEVFNHLNSQLPHGQRPQFLEPIEAILAGEPTVDLQEHEIDGNFYRTRFLPVHAKRENGLDAASPEGVIGVILDVTELKTKEADIEAQAREKQELVANEAAAKEASRLKSQFLANMSHEIRTPITGVLGMAELLLDLELGQEQREYTENIYRSASALLTVINDILDLSKVESGRLDIEEVPFSLSVIVGDVSKMLSFAAQRKNLFFQADIPWDVESDLVVMGDPGRVRQIITNILTNSIKFTNQGSVKFTVVKEKETTDMVEMKFVIEDTGIGIEDAVRDRLFQPFSQGDASTARKFGGTGLGLAICKNLLELMNGRITLESTLGAGTTASFWIPFNKPQASHQTDLVHINPLPDRLQSEMSLSCNSSEYEHGSPTLGGELPVASMEKSRASWQRKSMMSNIGVPPLPPEEYLGPSERSRINVFVVEDNAINQQIATKTIRKLGFNVNAAWNGREALDYLMAAKEGKHAKPDIILMDVQMPIIDGYKCTHLLRHHLPYKTYVDDIPIVAMTASAIQGDREKCWKAGMDDYLAKPVKSKTLEKMLVRWTITGRRPTSYPTQASDVFECQEENGHCDKAGIPAPGPDEYERNGAFSATTQAAVAPSLPLSSLNSALVHNSTDQGTVVKTGENTGEKDSAARAFPVPSLPTLDEMAAVPNTVPETVDDSAPRPPTFKGDSLTQALRFTDPDELAIQSRDDKLLGAAGASTTLPSSHHHHSLPHSLLQPAQSTGEALTEENIEKLEKGASKWRS